MNFQKPWNVFKKYFHKITISKHSHEKKTNMIKIKILKNKCFEGFFSFFSSNFFFFSFFFSYFHFVLCFFTFFFTYVKSRNNDIFLKWGGENDNCPIFLCSRSSFFLFSFLHTIFLHSFILSFFPSFLPSFFVFLSSFHPFSSVP